MIRNAAFASLFLLALGCAAAAQPEEDRALLVISGRISAVERAAGVPGSTWTDAWIAPEGEGSAPFHVRIAPTGVLDAEEFPLAPGDRVQVRVFSDESPLAVQQIRSRETGRMLRLRGLHGEPLWDSRQEGRAGGSVGPSGLGRGGPRLRTTR